MVWFIFSEVMFFACFFGALYYIRQISLPELGGYEAALTPYAQIYQRLAQRRPHG